LAWLAERGEPFLSLIDPDDATFLSPRDMLLAIATYCERTSQPRPKSPTALMRCCFESLALKYRYVLDQLEALIGRREAVFLFVGTALFAAAVAIVLGVLRAGR